MDELENDIKEELKNMLDSEIQIIRDSLSMVNMFFGESFKVGAYFLQEIGNPKLPNNE